MNVAEMILEIRNDGVTLALSSSGELKAGGDKAAVQKWVSDIRANKPRIVSHLQAEGFASETHPTGGADAFIRRAIPDATPREITAGLELLADALATGYGEADVIEVLTKAREMMASRGLDTDGKPLRRQGAGAGRG
ncbi:MAG: hypothetical protein LBP68_01960 [Acidobacteriota bacterium]|jgi:hypothetical protein|nr:hypothetical protein [Acidobacteriota bacterium]